MLWFLIFLVIMFLLRKHMKRFFLKAIIYILVGAIVFMLIESTLIRLIIALVFFVVLYLTSMDSTKQDNTKE